MWKLAVYALVASPLASLAAKCHHRPPQWTTSMTSSDHTSATPSPSSSSTPGSTPSGTPSTNGSTAASTPSTPVNGSITFAEGGYVQLAQGNASFTVYSGCGSAACGHTASKGFTAAMNQLAYGAPGGQGSGDACGRCFAITGNLDPYSPAFKTNWQTIVVRVTDLCPGGSNNEWCGQTHDNPLNKHGAVAHFDLCQESGAASAFFPANRGALVGTYTEVSCSQWSGTMGPPLWNGACVSDDTAPFWPAVSCGNKGTAP